MNLHPNYLSYALCAGESGLACDGFSTSRAHCKLHGDNGIDGRVNRRSARWHGYGTDGQIWGRRILVCRFLNSTPRHFAVSFSGRRRQRGSPAMAQPRWRICARLRGTRTVAAAPALSDIRKELAGSGPMIARKLQTVENLFLRTPLRRRLFAAGYPPRKRPTRGRRRLSSNGGDRRGRRLPVRIEAGDPFQIDLAPMIEAIVSDFVSDGAARRNSPPASTSPWLR